MKKRVCQLHCGLCGLNFESCERYTIHLSSRARLASEIQVKKQTQLLDTELVEDHRVFQVLVEDEEKLFVNESDGDIVNEQYNDFARSETESMDKSVSLSDIESGTESPSENDEFQEEREADMFPFPSEIFFLLYCYAHNVTRPKVN